LEGVVVSGNDDHVWIDLYAYNGSPLPFAVAAIERTDLHDAELNELRAENARLTALFSPPTIMAAEEVPK
jgi:hypothetical protein